MRHLRVTALRSISAMNYCAFLSVFYLLLASLVPANKTAMNLYHLDGAQYHILYTVVVLPIVASWFVAFYSYTKVRAYATSVAKTPDGPDFDKLANGFAWIAWGLPIPYIIGAILNSIANSHEGFHAGSLIIANYIALLVPLIAFSIISTGSRELLKRAKLSISPGSARRVILIFASIGVVFCYLTFRRFNLESLSDSNNPYFLPVWLIVLTIIVPYLYAWFVGLLSAFELSTLGQQAKGVLYRQAMRLFASGFVAVIASSIGLQYINSVVPRVGYLTLDGRLVTTYVLRAIAVAGYLMLAAGARKLKRIEEV